MDDFLTNFINWTQSQGPIRAIILQGSRAIDKADPYSDYDLCLFCKEDTPYTQDEGWLSSIGNVWVCVHEKIEKEGKIFPTRLVIFERGIKADFTFYPLEMLQDSDVKQGSLLLDKDHLISSLPKMNERPCKNPSEAEFQRVIQEFWFEAYHVAICLKRQDLWATKFRSSALQGFLLQMLEWKAQAKNGHSPPPNGKRMASWVDPNTWQALFGVFAHFDAEDSWQALSHILTLFRNLSIDVAQKIGTNYPEFLDKNMFNYITSLQDL